MNAGFQIAIEIFVGVELRGVGRQVLDRQTSPVVVYEALDGDRPVSVQVVPDHDHPATHVAQKMAEENQDLLRGDRPMTDQDVQLPIRADARDRRELRPAIAVRDHRGMPLGSPGTDTSRDQAEPALIYEDQRGFQPARFFLMRGHSSRTHRRTSASSRSTARPVGRW